jgi:membrane-associated phospholipid phosphatase
VKRLALGCALLTAVCIAFVDEPLARWLATRDTHPHAWERAIGVLEYAIGIEPWKWLGVTVLLTGVIVSLRWRRQAAAAWMIVASSHLLSRNLMFWGKVLTGRLRPSEWHGGATWFQGGSSFPSGHVVLFASLALPLAMVHPRLRVLVIVPVFAGLARIMAHAHFASDVVGGFALCAAVTALCTWAVRTAQQRGGAR